MRPKRSSRQAPNLDCLGFFANTNFIPFNFEHWFRLQDNRLEQASGSDGTAVYGTTSGTEGWGVHGTSSGTDGRGVYGYASGTNSYAVYGYNYRNVGVRGYTYYGRDGVQGEARIANGRGVYGDASGSEGIGVFGHASNTGYSAVTTGIYGVTSGGRGAGVRGISLSGASVNFGGYFQSYSTIGYGVLGYASGATGTNYGVLGRTASPAGYGVYSDGDMRVVGDFTATGTKSAVVKVGEKEHVLLYAEESTENWFTDYGKGKLNSGKTVVHIDPTFLQTVNTENEYHVFLTPKGDCKGLFVTNETPGSFEVPELGGGHSSIDFNYRIVVKRRGYESDRLARVSPPEDMELSKRVNTATPETVLVSAQD